MSRDEIRQWLQTLNHCHMMEGLSTQDIEQDITAVEILLKMNNINLMLQITKDLTNAT